MLPWLDNAHALRLRRGDAVLATRTLSAAAPTVKVDEVSTAPVGEPLTITWDSDDADGDALRHNVALSRDGGTSWVSVATDVAGETFTFTPSAQDTTSRALVRVTVSDGLRTASDVTDATFAIRPGTGAIAFSRSGRIMVANEDGSGATPVTTGTARLRTGLGARRPPDRVRAQRRGSLRGRRRRHG